MADKQIHLRFLNKGRYKKLKSIYGTSGTDRSCWVRSSIADRFIIVLFILLN
nr:MAG TPA: hypothetical protein [Caudoviricetes sp.]